MLKWKCGCRLKTLIKNEAGITLVELLATLSILSIVILLAGSIHMFGQRQFINQTESAEIANDLSYALNIMSSDLRRQSLNNVSIDSNEIYIKKNEQDEFSPNPTYFINEKNQLINNDAVIADSVSELLVKFDGTNIGIEITLKSMPQHTSQKVYSTKVTFRRLPDNDTYSN